MYREQLIVDVSEQRRSACQHTIERSRNRTHSRTGLQRGGSYILGLFTFVALQIGFRQLVVRLRKREAGMSDSIVQSEYKFNKVHVPFVPLLTFASIAGQ